MVSLQAWNDPAVIHGFMGRLGGVSRGPFESLNLASWVGDDPEAVAANLRRWHAGHPAVRMIAEVRQVHGNIVHTIDETYAGARQVDGDGMVTRKVGTLLAIYTADCVPILMIDAKRGVAGALHAGWRGTFARIAGEGVRAMEKAGARVENIQVAMGPAIGPCCFEVDADLAERFVREIDGAHRHTRAGRPGKAYLDLRAILRDQFERAGIDPQVILDVGPCTKCDSAHFFSRRAAGGIATGLQVSFVGFKE